MSPQHWQELIDHRGNELRKALIDEVVDAEWIVAKIEELIDAKVARALDNRP